MRNSPSRVDACKWKETEIYIQLLRRSFDFISSENDLLITSINHILRVEARLLYCFLVQKESTIGTPRNLPCQSHRSLTVCRLFHRFQPNLLLIYRPEPRKRSFYVLQTSATCLFDFFLLKSCQLRKVNVPSTKIILDY